MNETNNKIRAGRNWFVDEQKELLKKLGSKESITEIDKKWIEKNWSLLDGTIRKRLEQHKK